MLKFQLKLDIAQTPESIKNVITSDGRLYGQHDLSLNSEESEIIKRKGIAQYSTKRHCRITLSNSIKKGRSCRES